MKNTTPCKDCFDRTITCHSVCRRYQDWKKEHEEQMAARRAEREKYSTLSEHSKRKSWANKRLANRKYVKK